MSVLCCYLCWSQAPSEGKALVQNTLVLAIRLMSHCLKAIYTTALQLGANLCQRSVLEDSSANVEDSSANVLMLWILRGQE